MRMKGGCYGKLLLNLDILPQILMYANMYWYDLKLAVKTTK